MVTNLEQGRSIKFATRFKDATGSLVEPSSANLTLFYTTFGVSTSETIDLIRNGSYWTGTWDSSPADPGLVVWIAGSPISGIAEAGELRITQTKPPIVPATTLRFAANRARWLTNSDVANNQVMARSGHKAWVDIFQIQIYVQNSRNSPVNILNDFAGEFGFGTPATVTASIEYPVGVFTQVTFNGGSPSVSVLNRTILISDPITMPTPIGAGHIFWVRQFWQNAGGIFFNAWQDVPTYGDAVRIAPGGLIDQTMGGTIVDNSGYSFPPAAIIAQSSLLSLGIVGDSIGYGNCGVGSEPPPYIAATGVIAKSLAASVPLQNLSVCGAHAAATAGFYWLTTGTPRRELVKYCTHVVSELGINDLDGAGGGPVRTAAQLQSDLQALWAILVSVYGLPSTAPIFQSTLSPHTTSVDSWTSLVGQTPAAETPQRILFNTATRSLFTGLSGEYDVASALESSLNSGLWAVGGGNINLLPNSNQMDLWFNIEATVSNSISDAFGGSAAWQIIESFGGTLHFLALDTPPAPGGDYVFSVYAKYNGRRLELRIAGVGGADFAYVVFDLAGSQVGTSGTGGVNFSFLSGYVISLGGGWFRCVGLFSCAADIAGAFLVCDNGIGNAALSQVYAGDGVSGVFVMDAQLESGSVPTAYTPAQPIALTIDGLHPSNLGYDTVVAAGVVTPP